VRAEPAAAQLRHVAGASAGVLYFPRMPKGILVKLAAAALGVLAAEREIIAATNVSHAFIPILHPYSDDMLRSLRTPPGFKVNVFARNQGNARMMLLLPDGTILVTRNDVGEVFALRDRNADGVADEWPVVARIPLVHGLALRDNVVYLASETKLLAMTWNANGTFGGARAFANLPAGGLHPRRTLGFDDGGYLYVSVGSDCNNCAQANPELATMLRMRPDGSARTIFARGLRNALGFAWHPQTKQLWAWDNGSDGRGDALPPEELDLLTEGNDYGWPSCYGQRQVDKVTRTDSSIPPRNCPGTTPMVRGYPAHSAPISFLFYTGTQFPAAFHNNGFVSFHGSWNREHVKGYKVVRVRFQHGVPMGFQDFVTGWLTDNGTSQFGRPAGLVVAGDGSLLISDDNNGMIYRVSYTGHR
jgi:glucose/arabinose dehydrogenase